MKDYIQLLFNLLTMLLQHTYKQILTGLWAFDEEYIFYNQISILPIMLVLILNSQFYRSLNWKHIYALIPQRIPAAYIHMTWMTELHQLLIIFISTYCASISLKIPHICHEYQHNNNAKRKNWISQSTDIRNNDEFALIFLYRL